MKLTALTLVCAGVRSPSNIIPKSVPRNIRQASIFSSAPDSRTIPTGPIGNYLKSHVIQASWSQDLQHCDHHRNTILTCTWETDYNFLSCWWILKNIKSAGVRGSVFVKFCRTCVVVGQPMTSWLFFSWSLLTVTGLLHVSVNVFSTFSMVLCFTC